MHDTYARVTQAIREAPVRPNASDHDRIEGITHSPCHSPEADADAHADIAYQIHLKDIDVDMAIPPTEPLLVPLIRGGKGIATFAGLLPGGTWSVAVSGGERANPLRDGMRVTVRSANIANGKPFAIPGALIPKDAGDPAEFFQNNGPHAGLSIAVTPAHRQKARNAIHRNAIATKAHLSGGPSCLHRRCDNRSKKSIVRTETPIPTLCGNP